MKCHSLCSGKNTENIILSSAELAKRVVKVSETISLNKDGKYCSHDSQE